MRLPTVLAAFAAVVLSVSTAFAQTVSETWPTVTTPCEQVLHPAHPANMVRVRQLLTDGQVVLSGLPETADDASSMASRDRARAMFQEAHELSAGDLTVVYNHGQALRRLRHREVALHVLECLQGAPNYATLPVQVRDTVAASTIALRRDIEAAQRTAPPVRPPVGPVITPPGPRIVGPGPRVTPPVTQRTPHPRSPAMRTAGRVLTGAGAATFVAGVVTTVLCAVDVNGDRSYLDDANRGAPHGWSEGRAQRLDQLCLAGPIMMGVGAAVGSTGAVLWRIGGQQVTDPQPPAPIRTGTNGIPIVSFAPTSGGGQASAIWRF